MKNEYYYGLKWKGSRLLVFIVYGGKTSYFCNLKTRALSGTILLKQAPKKHIKKMYEDMTEREITALRTALYRKIRAQMEDDPRQIETHQTHTFEYREPSLC